MNANMPFNAFTYLYLCTHILIHINAHNVVHTKEIMITESVDNCDLVDITFNLEGNIMNADLFGKRNRNTLLFTFCVQ